MYTLEKLARFGVELDDMSSVPACAASVVTRSLPTLAVGENLNADLLVTLFFNQLLEFFVADGDVVARRHGMADTQRQRTRGVRREREPQNHCQSQGEDENFTHTHLS